MKPTLQEIQLVQFLAQGLSAKQIADLLTPARSRRTVEKYISDMLDKFNAKNSPHLVAMFLDNKWIVKQPMPCNVLAEAAVQIKSCDFNPNAIRMDVKDFAAMCKASFPNKWIQVEHIQGEENTLKLTVL